MFYLFVIAIIVFIIDWSVMGIKLFDNNYDITTEAYIGLACWGVMIVCGLYRVFANKCPHCGKTKLTNGDYCSYCGKKVN